jgi:predicted ABC-type transport system involved in lysophospholipase L1 biosynthesis ATPase subunit
MSQRHIETAAETADIIRMEAIRKVYDTGKVKVEALKGIDLAVTPGEFVAIVGPSGSGKSTLMNLIGCLDTPTEGRYRLGGEDVSKLDKDQLADVRNRRVGFVFQGFNLLPQITSFENVEMPLVFGGVPLAERRRRVTELLARHGFATISLLSLIPNPLTPFACGTAGAMGMGFRRFVLASLLGRIALGLLLAYLGESIVNWIDPHRRV